MIVVDAYNTLHAWRNAPMQEDGRDVAALARLIMTSGFGTDSVHLVCDGTPPSGHDGIHEFTASGARITYAGAGQEADALIENIIERSSAPARLIVVSSDRRIQRAARRRRATALSSERFLALVVSNRGSAGQEQSIRPGQLSGDEVHHWLKEFGLKSLPPEADPQEQATDHHSEDARGTYPELPPDLDPGDLDMSQWLDDVDPMPPRDPSDVRFPDPPFGGSNRSA